MANPLLSVIVPVYKCTDTLDRCVESVLAQNFSDFELILVDDGSPDESGALCDAWSARDTRITALHQKNGGASAARNTGLAAAKGTYIEFLDSDDSLLPGLFEAALPIMEAEKLDLYLFCLQRLSDGGCYRPPVTGFFKSPAALRQWFFPLFCEGGHFESPCNKIFRRSVIGELRFDPKLRVNEDVLFNLCYLLKCGALRLTDTACYLQDDRGGESLSRSMNADFLQAEASTRPVLIFFLSECGLSQAEATAIVDARRAAACRNQFGILTGRGGALPFGVQRRAFAEIFAFAPARTLLLKQLAADPNRLQAGVIAFCVRFRLAAALTLLCKLKNLFLGGSSYG